LQDRDIHLRSRIIEKLPNADAFQIEESKIPTRDMPPRLSEPPRKWLEDFNNSCRKRQIGASVRAMIGIVEWAEANGVIGNPADIWTAYCNSDTYQAIEEYLREHSGAARAHLVMQAPQSCFFYDDAFWPVSLDSSRTKPSPVPQLKEMPEGLRQHLEEDADATEELSAHLAECVYVARFRYEWKKGPIVPKLASDFFQGAERSLDSALTNLLANPPNEEAAELSRDTFESALKALVAALAGLTAKKARQISHQLDELVQGCRPLVDPSISTRLQAAIGYFPAVHIRYEPSPIRGTRLWKCYSEAYHALFVTLSTTREALEEAELR